MRSLRAVGLLLLLCSIPLVGASQVYQINDYGTDGISGGHIGYCLDTFTQTDFDFDKSRLFFDEDITYPNLGFSTQPVWACITLINTSSTEDVWINYTVPYVTRIQIYDSTEGGEFAAGRVAGVNYPKNELVQDVGYYFDVIIPKGETKTFWFHIQSEQQLILGFEVGTPKQITAELWVDILFYGLFVGIMLVMFLYNLVIFFVTRIRLYLFYVIYVLFSLLTQCGLTGVYQTFFPFFGISNNMLAMYLFVSGVAISGNMFVYRFIDVKKHVPNGKSFFQIVFWSYIVSAICAVLGWFTISTFLLQINAIYCAVLIIWLSALIGFKKKERAAKILFVAWILFMLGNIIYVLKDFGVLPFNRFTMNVSSIGTAIETVLLSLALADLINRMRASNQRVKTRILLEERRNSDLVLRLHKSELLSLQGQMNPHFVFNVLSSIQSEINQQKYQEANSRIARFAKLMRSGLEFSRQSTVTLEDEVEFLENYLQLEQKRFDGRFDFEIHCEDGLLDSDLQIPPLFLQPICENAIKHAFHDDKGELYLKFELIGNAALRCSIDDNGLGFDYDKVLDKNEGGKHLGLQIIQERIQLFKDQGKEASIRFINKSKLGPSNHGMLVELVLPVV